MAITVQNVRDFDRTFADSARYPDQLITSYIAMFFNFFAVSRLPATVQVGQQYSTRDLANLLFTCHNLTAQADGSAGKSGATNREKVGDVEVGYAVSNDMFGAPDYSLTVYGTNLLRLLRPFSTYAIAVG